MGKEAKTEIWQRLGMVVQALNPSNWEAEQADLSMSSKAIQGYIERSYLKKKKRKKKKEGRKKREKRTEKTSSINT